jgi:hypothetical protein
MVLVAVILFAPTTRAKVWTTVYHCDETTPLAALDPNQATVYRDIMVGTRLVFVVSSDTGESWQGALLLSSDEVKYGTLSGRGYTPAKPGTSIRAPNYADSCLDAAGTGAYVWVFGGTEGVGLQFQSGHTPYITAGHPAVPGDWFIFDYHAEQVGFCKVGLYTGDDPNIPLEMLLFRHVLSRDFNGDTVVDFADFALLASHWDASVGQDPNSRADTFDLNADTRVDLADLVLFSEYWLERTDCSKAATDSKKPSTDRP